VVFRFSLKPDVLGLYFLFDKIMRMITISKKIPIKMTSRINRVLGGKPEPVELGGGGIVVEVCGGILEVCEGEVVVDTGGLV
jgi:hypothetical protein